MDKHTKAVLTVIAASTVSGCASIVSDDQMNMTVESEPQGAECRLVNQEGTFVVKTPQTVPIDTTCKPMQVTCKLDGYKTVQQEVDYSHKGAAWGNILAGGGIGYIVDRQTGAGCDYPQSILVTLDKEDS